MVEQKLTKKIQLKEGLSTNINYQGLNLGTLLQVYDEKSAAHLVGDVYLRVDLNGKSIADFYVDNDKSKVDYLTKIYKNHLFTFVPENGNYYLNIEPAQFGRTFALSSQGSAIVGTNNDFIEVEITNYLFESIENSSFDDEEITYSSDVFYTLKVTKGDVARAFRFYSSDLKNHFVIDMGSHSIIILSDLYKDSSSLLEMIVDKD